MITDPEGPSFIVRTVEHRQYSDGAFVTHDPILSKLPGNNRCGAPHIGEVGGQGNVITELPPFTTVTLVKREQGWALVAKDGKVLGYVADASQRKLN
jgi:hypothetical protein